MVEKADSLEEDRMRLDFWGAGTELGVSSKGGGEQLETSWGWGGWGCGVTEMVKGLEDL